MATTMFQKEIYLERRKQLKQLVGHGTVLLPGNDQSSMKYRDNWYPFRQDGSFFFAGLSLENSQYKHRGYG